MYPQTVLITGGATGIGFALAKKFHDAGHQIILVGRRRERLEAAVAALPGARAYVADITLALDRERLRERFPEVSILINNAGIQNSGGILEQTSEQMAREVWVNFLAPVFLTQAFLPALLAHPGGGGGEHHLRAGPRPQGGCAGVQCRQGGATQLYPQPAAATPGHSDPRCGSVAAPGGYRHDCGSSPGKDVS